ncbi:unnamed protein product, partial [Ixodes hexagonus]
SPSYQRQRSPNRSVRRKPRSSPRRYHGSHSSGCVSATASPQRDAAVTSTCVSRSQSMRNSKRPQALQYHFRQRIASIPGDMLAAQHQDAPGASCNDSRGSSNNSLPTADEAGDVLRLRNFAVTSKGIVNRGDSFRSKSRSTHSVSSTGSSGANDHKLAVPIAASVSASPSETSGDAGPSDVTSSGRTGDSPLARHRVLVLGASQVGKTSLTSQFMTSEYICSYDSSIGK